MYDKWVYSNVLAALRTDIHRYLMDLVTGFPRHLACGSAKVIVKDPEYERHKMESTGRCGSARNASGSEIIPKDQALAALAEPYSGRLRCRMPPPTTLSPLFPAQKAERRLQQGVASKGTARYPQRIT